jgi:hypothetical protein
MCWTGSITEGGSKGGSEVVEERRGAAFLGLNARDMAALYTPLANTRGLRDCHRLG